MIKGGPYISDIHSDIYIYNTYTYIYTYKYTYKQIYAQIYTNIRTYTYKYTHINFICLFI